MVKYQIHNYEDDIKEDDIEHLAFPSLFTLPIEERKKCSHLWYLSSGYEIGKDLNRPKALFDFFGRSLSKASFRYDWRNFEFKTDPLRAKAYVQYCSRSLLAAITDDTTDPNQLFTPSRKLSNLFNKCMDTPNEDELEELNRIREFHGQPQIEELSLSDITSFITEQIEGFLSNLAKRSDETKEPIKLTNSGRFTAEICRELVDRLELDAYNPQPVLERLYLELVKFASLVPRDRFWGRITVHDSELILEISEETLSFPDFEKVGEDRWIATE